MRLWTVDVRARLGNASGRDLESKWWRLTGIRSRNESTRHIRICWTEDSSKMKCPCDPFEQEAVSIVEMTPRQPKSRWRGGYGRYSAFW